jgi:A/G-specific adenine glycosylase
MAEWAGLGYYSRARNLVACAHAVAQRGGFPDSEDELRQAPRARRLHRRRRSRRSRSAGARWWSTPTSNASLPACSRSTSRCQARARRSRSAGGITPAERAGDFAQAMMDLGATICTFRAPKCLLCPLSPDCLARAQGRQAELPRQGREKAKPQRIGTAFWIERGGKVWLVRRPAKGMLGGMRALPEDGWNARADGSGDAPIAGAWRAGGVVQHGFTHLDLELALAIYAGDKWAGLEAGVSGGRWMRSRAAGLPTLFAKAARLATAGA